MELNIEDLQQLDQMLKHTEEYGSFSSSCLNNSCKEGLAAQKSARNTVITTSKSNSRIASLLKFATISTCMYHEIQTFSTDSPSDAKK